MAFLRFTRDKRGYEHFYLVQPSHGRGRSTARVLYWFRTPPSVKVGREPFDESIRRELEAQNPDVTFDWRKILETPIPSADAEKWRDRRRAERAARAAKRGAVVEDGAESLEEGAEEESLSAAPVHVLEAAAESAGSDVRLSEPPDLTVAAASNEGTEPQTIESGTENPSTQLRPVGSDDGSHRKRRRRRRRRGHTGPPGSGGSPPAGPAGDV